MTDKIKVTAQQEANKKQNEKRKGGTASFSTVRFNDSDKLDDINATIKEFGGTKESALIAAFGLLRESLNNKE